MKAEALALFPYKSLVVLGLLAFVSVFAGMLVWTFLPRRRQILEQASRLPLET